MTANVTAARRLDERTANSTRLAHLSDLHLLGATPGRERTSYGFDVRFVSIGRRLDAQQRRRSFARALEVARRAGATHYALSGDLTETGSQAQFEEVAEVLAESGIPAEQVTLVPGNHDAYDAPDAWQRAMAGPLRRYAETSARADGVVVERGDVAFLPLDVACHQPVTRSAGELSTSAAEVLERRLRDTALRNRALVVVQHHHPFRHSTRVWQWIDGLRGWDRIMAMLEQFPAVQVLHGHLHKTIDRTIGKGRVRVFGAPAIVDDEPGASGGAVRVRLYDVRDGALESCGMLTA